MLKRWKGYRTYILNGVTAILLVVPEIINLLSVHDWVPPRYLVYLGVLNIIGNVWLRTLKEAEDNAS